MEAARRQAVKQPEGGRALRNLAMRRPYRWYRHACSFMTKRGVIRKKRPNGPHRKRVVLLTTRRCPVCGGRARPVGRISREDRDKLPRVQVGMR